MKNKRVRKAAVWVMTILMIGSVVASILAYFIKG